MTVDLGLSREFMLPIRTYKGFSLDRSYRSGAAFEELGEGEAAVFQVLFQVVRNPWQESILRAVTDWEGVAFQAQWQGFRLVVSRPMAAEKH